MLQSELDRALARLKTGGDVDFPRGQPTFENDTPHLLALHKSMVKIERRIPLLTRFWCEQASRDLKIKRRHIIRLRCILQIGHQPQRFAIEAAADLRQPIAEQDRLIGVVGEDRRRLQAADIGRTRGQP